MLQGLSSWPSYCCHSSPLQSIEICSFGWLSLFSVLRKLHHNSFSIAAVQFQGSGLLQITGNKLPPWWMISTPHYNLPGNWMFSAGKLGCQRFSSAQKTLCSVDKQYCLSAAWIGSKKDDPLLWVRYSFSHPWLLLNRSQSPDWRPAPTSAPECSEAKGLGVLSTGLSREVFSTSLLNELMTQRYSYLKFCFVPFST